MYADIYDENPENPDYDWQYITGFSISYQFYKLILHILTKYLKHISSLLYASFFSGKTEIYSKKYSKL